MSDYKPVVGKECEFNNRKDTWIDVSPRYVSKTFVVYEYEGREYIEQEPFKNKFRPPRTPEDIEREEAIEEMISHDPLNPVSNGWKKKFCGDLYGSGYRLVGEKVGADTLRLEFNRARYPASNGMTLDDAIWLLANYNIYRKVEK